MRFTKPAISPDVSAISSFHWFDRAFQYEDCVYIVLLDRPKCFVFNTDTCGRQEFRPAQNLGHDIEQVVKMWFDADYEMPIVDFLNGVLGV